MAEETGQNVMEEVGLELKRLVVLALGGRGTDHDGLYKMHVHLCMCRGEDGPTEGKVYGEMERDNQIWSSLMANVQSWV